MASSYRQQLRSSAPQNGEWMYSHGGSRKPTAVNAVPLSTASTAAASPRTNATNSPPPGFGEQALLTTPPGTFVNDCPPSPGLTKRLLALAQGRKRAGRHNLVSTSASGKRVLRLSVQVESPAGSRNPVDRWGIPEDLYGSLLATAGEVKKQSGQHIVQRRRMGLSGEVKPVLVMMSDRNTMMHHNPNHSSFAHTTTSTVSIFSPDPSLF